MEQPEDISVPVYYICIFVRWSSQKIYLSAGGKMTGLEQEYQALGAEFKPHLVQKLPKHTYVLQNYSNLYIHCWVPSIII